MLMPIQLRVSPRGKRIMTAAVVVCCMVVHAEGRPAPAAGDPDPVVFSNPAIAADVVPPGMQPTRNPDFSDPPPPSTFVTTPSAVPLTITNPPTTNASLPVGNSPEKGNSVSAGTAASVARTNQPSLPPSSPALLSVDGTISTNAMSLLDDKHKLAIGDRLSFRIIEDEEEPKALFVTDSGDLEVPYIGRFPAEGKTCFQLGRELKTEFEKDYYHQATVIVAVDLMAKTRGRVYLVGAVRAAGPQEVPSDEVFTLSKAILRAGGFSDFSDRKNVRVTRKATRPEEQDKTFIIDVNAILERGKTDRDIVLEPGDFIYVPERSIRF